MLAFIHQDMVNLTMHFQTGRSPSVFMNDVMWKLCTLDD